MAMEMKGIIKPFGSQSFLIGIGAAALVYLFGPQLKEALRPAAVKGAQGVMALGDKTKQMFEEGKERVAGMLFEKTDEAADKVKEVVAEGMGVQADLVKEFMEEREAHKRLLEELKDSVASLKEEMAQMRNSSGGLQQQ